MEEQDPFTCHPILLGGEYMKVLLVIVLLTMTAIGVVAQDCSTDGLCNMECINNTIDEFDADCGVAETELYSSSSVQMKLVDIEEPEESVLIVRPCPQIKDGVCETTCQGVDLDCLCGDFECQTHENVATCPNDCGYEKNKLCVIIRDNYCDESCLPFDADCAKSTISQTTKDIEARFNLPKQTVQTTLVLIFIVLCGIVIYLMHKAFELKQGRK